MDASDAHVFAQAAEPGEWAITGSFVFAADDPDALTGKRRQAFRNGFLGTASFGWATFAVVAPISEAEYEVVVGRLADHLLALYGAPDREAALAAAREEAAFAASLCDHPVNTVITIEREFTAEGIVENFRTVDAAADAPANAWKIEDTTGD
jgi:hypothetical protein